MSEIQRLVDELKSIYDGDAWHGPSLREILADVSAEQAQAKPIASGHSIWEIVSHLAAWEHVFIRRLEGHPTEEPEEGDFPPTTDASEQAWKQTLTHLDSSHAKLVRTISDLADARVNETVVGEDYSTGFMLRGIVRHTVYHSGQIALLRKATFPRAD